MSFDHSFATLGYNNPVNSTGADNFYTLKQLQNDDSNQTSFQQKKQYFQQRYRPQNFRATEDQQSCNCNSISFPTSQNSTNSSTNSSTIPTDKLATNVVNNVVSNLVNNVPSIVNNVVSNLPSTTTDSTNTSNNISTNQQPIINSNSQPNSKNDCGDFLCADELPGGTPTYLTFAQAKQLGIRDIRDYSNEYYSTDWPARASYYT